jgi:hypothetical protein
MRLVNSDFKALNSKQTPNSQTPDEGRKELRDEDLSPRLGIGKLANDE